MPTTIVIDHLAGRRAGQRQEFDPRPRLRFGRHPDNDVAFDPHGDLDASTRHAELRQEAGSWVLVDVGSSNGTFVGGAKISRHPIPEGMPVEVEFGQGGPRCRIFIGDPAMLAVPMTMIAGGAPRPAVPETVARTPGSPGRRTVAMMVQKAMADAHAAHGLGKSTMFVRSMVDSALHHSTKRFKLILISMGSAFALIVAGLVWMNVRASKEVEKVRDEMKVAAADPEVGPRIVRENKQALWLLFYVGPDGAEAPFCSSFAVTPTILATNSHCVDVVNNLRGQNLKVMAVQNGTPERRLELGEVLKHPDYASTRARQTTDVALVEVKGTMEKLVKLATRERLEQLTQGMQVFVYGFPGRLAKPAAPEATITAGPIGRITDLSEKVSAFDDNRLIQHSAFTMEGTSGSPVFDSTGVVIAVNTGSYVREKELKMFDPETKQFQQKVAVPEALAGYNVAIRIDAVHELLVRKGVKPGLP